MSRQIYGTWTLIVTTSPRLESYLHAKVICGNCVPVLVPSYVAFLGVPAFVYTVHDLIGSLSKSSHNSQESTVVLYMYLCNSITPRPLYIPAPS
jgi:hypothetical protein